MNIFVGNLAAQITEAELVEAFKPFGDVKSAQVIRDMFTGVSKGFGFVEMPGKAHSLAAIAGLNGKEFHGKPLRVNESRPRPGGGGRRR
jgi:RNA recognition motif-containing protein